MVAVLILDNRRVFSGIGVLSAGTTIPKPPKPPNAATRSLRLAGTPPESGDVLTEVMGSDIWLLICGKVVFSPPGFLSSPKMIKIWFYYLCYKVTYRFP